MENEKRRFTSSINKFIKEFDAEDKDIDFNRKIKYFQRRYPLWNKYISDNDYQDDLG